jgi:hypothetical protein
VQDSAQLGGLLAALHFNHKTGPDTRQTRQVALAQALGLPGAADGLADLDGSQTPHKKFLLGTILGF